MSHACGRHGACRLHHLRDHHCEDATKDERVLDAITFQRGMHDAIYLDMIGNPETEDCVIVRLTESITFQVNGLDYTGLGKAGLIEVTSLGKYSLRKLR